MSALPAILLIDTRARQRQFRALIAVTFVLFVGYTMLTLALLGRFGDLARMPAEFAPVAAVIRPVLSGAVRFAEPAA